MNHPFIVVAFSTAILHCNTIECCLSEHVGTEGFPDNRKCLDNWWFDLWYYHEWPISAPSPSLTIPSRSILCITNFTIIIIIVHQNCLKFAIKAVLSKKFPEGGGPLVFYQVTYSQNYGPTLSYIMHKWYFNQAEGPHCPPPSPGLGLSLLCSSSFA